MPGLAGILSNRNTDMISIKQRHDEVTEVMLAIALFKVNRKGTTSKMKTKDQGRVSRYALGENPLKERISWPWMN